MRSTLAALAILAAAAGSASADDFENKARGAVAVPDAEAMTALFWSLEENCATRKDDMHRRQCEGVQARRRQEVVGKTYLVAGEGAVDIGTYDAKALSVDVTVRSCVACNADGERWVLGKGKHKADKAGIEAASMSQSAKTFKDDDHAQHWIKYIAPRLRSQFLVTLPAKPERFSAGGKKGFKVDVVGYRVYDPCKGEVLWSKPKAGDAPVDVSTCKGEPKMAVKEPPKPIEPPKPAEPDKPDRLSTSQINDALKTAREQSQRCFAAYGISGTASFRLTIAGNGTLKSLEQTGDFVGTPTGTCLEDAIRATAFPRSKKKELSVTYPIVLQ